MLVVLRNNTEEDSSVVMSTIVLLKGLIQTNPSAAIELVRRCRDPEEIVPSSLRNIVLSAVEGDGATIQFRSPLKYFS